MLEGTPLSVESLAYYVFRSHQEASMCRPISDTTMNTSFRRTAASR